ncbi:hypothetical protein KI811_02720 [Geobacter hydrogenophilus]|uniref:Uncharacterized protein n=1 Tax=Geobacter hydrogenophilus TaxID=40983 RepID=A0A9W6LDQ7_9BACT|nr:hypothetical protein [Geobacter hydrogenophilus]MBT0892738.1 hypothetical protein [Geobacter hydrogenophilus]GLI40137.1 hypothetical protein GHYDROH2_36380 [Geobacter hydrogenophilus]
MTVSCPQCGAPVEARTETRFHHCPFCTSSFVAEEGRGIAEYYLAHNRDDRLAWSTLASTLEGERNDSPVERLGCEHLVAPFWLSRSGGGTRLVPALRHPWFGVTSLVLPGGDLLYVPKGSDFTPPDIPVAEALANGAGKEPASLSLVHLPLYLLTFRVNGSDCRAVVSAVDRRAYLLDPLPRSAATLPLRHAVLVAGYALLLIIVGLAVKNHLHRAVAFAVIFGMAYFSFTAFLRREA